MMDFEGKQEMVQNVEKNGTMYQRFTALQQMAYQMAQILDSQMGTQMVQAMAAQGLLEGVEQAAGAVSGAPTGGNGGQPSGIVERARAQASEATAPR